MAILLTLSAVVVPQTIHGLERSRAAGAARYVSARLQHARLEAVLRSTEVGIQIVESAGGYTMALYRDGNGNGVRTADIRDGTDPPVAPIERLPDRFPNVDFGLYPNLPPVDPGNPPPTGDPVKLGASDIVSFSAHGSSTSGSLYVRGAGGHQLVLRIYGATGKVRALELNRRLAAWRPL